MSWRLLFAGTQSTVWMVIAIVTIIATVAISYWLLRYERQFVSRTVGLTLMSIRLSILAVLLFTMLQPVLTRSWDVSKRGRVIVGIDVSGSMETEDRHASTTEKLRWAQSLGMLGNAQTDPLIDEWISALQAGRQPDWLGAAKPIQTEQDRQRAAGRQKQVSAVLREFDRMSRVEFVSRLLNANQQAWLKDVNAILPVDLRMFATTQQKVPEQLLQQSLQDNHQPMLPQGTDAIQFLTSIISEESTVPVHGVVLLTDGRQTAPSDPAAEARRLGSLNIPVFTIPIGSARTPRDLSIITVDGPETVFLRDAAQVVATLGTAGFEGQSLAVRLEKNGVTVEQRQVIPATSTTSVAFEIPSDEAGRFDYQIVTDVQDAELRDDNNSRSFNLQVVDNKAQVLLVDGDARWEFRYLYNLLERDAQVELSAVLFRQPNLKLLNEPFLRSELPPAEQLQEQLLRTDLLILGDVAAQNLTAETWQLIESTVATEGLSLVIIPGHRHMPHLHSSELLDALLPVTDVRQRLAEKFKATEYDSPQSVFQLVPTTDGAEVPMFQVDAQDADSNTGLPQARSFQQLAGHPWAYTATPRPSAVVWADAQMTGPEQFQEPVIVHQHYGFGQVVWMGIDSTWRWRKRVGDSLHHRFWGQLIRWAARNKAAAGNDQVRLTLSDVLINETQSAQVTARWTSAALPLLQGASVEVELIPETSGVETSGVEASGAEASGAETSPAETGRSVLLQPAQDRAEQFSARLPRLPPGLWQVRLKVSGGNIQFKQPVETVLQVQPFLSAELANISCNRPLLQQISELSGGQMVEPFLMKDLASLLQPRDMPDSKLEERRIWDHGLLLLLLFALLMSEWVTRKLNGLP